MEREHKVWLSSRFEALQLPPVEVLDIPDEYEYMEPQLQEILRLTQDPEINALITANDNSA
jgi:predicted protein tyrosine phosphatase